MVNADASASPSLPRSDRYVLPLILLLTLILRGAVVWFRSDQLWVDRDAYLGIAQNLANGIGFCTPDSTQPTAFRPPLYPLLLAIHFPRLPHNDSITDRQFTVALWNILAGLWTVLLVDRIGRALGLGAWRHLASLLVAVDPLLLYATCHPMTEVVFTALVTAWLWSVVTPRPMEPDKSLLWWLWTGVLFGLAALCRPTIWPLAPLMAIAMFIPPAARRRLRQKLPSIAAAMLGTLLVVSPWIVRNYRVLGHPILMTTHGGYTLLLANNPVYQREVIEQPRRTVWSGESLARWQQDVEARLHHDLGPAPTELQRDAWMSAEAWKYIRAEPIKFAQAALHRVRSLWSITPQGEGASLPMVLRLGVGAFFAAEYLLAIVGIALLVRRREWPAWLPALLVIITLQIVHLFYWTDARMRAPLQPILALLAAKTLSVFCGRRRGR